MEPIITIPVPVPSSKSARPSTEKWAATLAEERLRLQEDMDVLREREGNLREYESRLRQLQAEIEAGRAPAVNFGTNAPLPFRSTPPVFQRPTSRTPFTDDASLQAAWEKLHRAREILEAEQKNLRDERISIQEQEIAMKRREEAVAEREERLAEREALVIAAAGGAPRVQRLEEVNGSAVSRITRVPFDMARSVFGGKKAS